jgi:hypothetical protein
VDEITICIKGADPAVGRAGLEPPTAAATIEPLLELLLIFIGMKEMKTGLQRLKMS